MKSRFPFAAALMFALSACAHSPTPTAIGSSAAPLAAKYATKEVEALITKKLDHTYFCGSTSVDDIVISSGESPDYFKFKARYYESSESGGGSSYRIAGSANMAWKKVRITDMDWR